MIQDPQFGPVVMFGLGGIFVEVMKDVSFRVAPLTREDIREMIMEIKAYPLLIGYRGDPPKDVGAVQAINGKVSEIALAYPEIQEIDLNPAVIHENGASILNSQIILSS